MANKHSRNVTVRNLAGKDYLINRTNYRNGISTKFDNRRVTVVKIDEGWILEFRSMDNEPKPHALCRHVHGKMAITGLILSNEAAELLMRSLAELMGHEIY